MHEFVPPDLRDSEGKVMQMARGPMGEWAGGWTVAVSCVIGVLFLHSPSAFGADSTPAVEDGEAIEVIRTQFTDWWSYWFQQNDDKAARLRMQFDQAWSAHDKVPASYLLTEGSAAFNRRVDVEQSLFLCTWKGAHAPPGNPKPLDICNAHGSAREQGVADPIERVKVAHAAQAAEEKAAAMKVAAEHEARFSRNVKSMTAEDICRNYHETRYAAARQELSRRKTLSPQEWKLVDRGSIQVGVSELALLCALGDAPVKRTVSARGVLKQYTYPGGVFVYVENGVVTSFQDRR